LSDKNALSSASLSGKNATQNLTPQEQLLAGTLELDPENDPVIYTTDYGLDIKWHLASPLPTNPNEMQIMPDGQKCATYAYFTHANVNWVIIGCSNKSTTIDNGILNLANIAGYYQKAGYYNFSNTTSGIWQYLNDATEDALAADLTDVYANYGGFFYNQTSNTFTHKDIFPNAKSTDELEFGEVLCLAQNYLETLTTKYIYNNSPIVTYLHEFWGNNLTDLSIVKQTTLKTYLCTNEFSGTGGLIDSKGDYNIFLLAGKNVDEDFYVLNYLTDGAESMQQSNIWWTRSYASGGSSMMSIGTNGKITSAQYYNSSTAKYNYYGVRPAFVLKI
ncbi:MAG: hypothetical protein J6A98_02150, partial [Clostridia bacterium]|nr:hypothetical protein [Clostridia bacterium]